MEREHFVLGALEAEAPEIVGKDWLKSLDRNLIDNLGKYRKYDGGSVRDLLRVMRNKVGLLVSERVLQGTPTKLTPICLSRNITIKTCPKMFVEAWESRRLASCLISPGASLNCSFTFMALSSNS